MKRDPDVVHVYSAIAPDGKTPMVGWHLNGRDGMLTLLEARDRAEAFFLAAAIADTEARIALKISGLKDEKPKGFGAKSSPSKQEEFFYQINMMMRDERLPLPDGIKPIFGWKTRLPLIDVDLYGELFQWEPDQAREHARWLLECADASESDRFFYAFLKEKLDISAEKSNAMLQEFAGFRNRTRLEDLLNRE